MTKKIRSFFSEEKHLSTIIFSIVVLVAFSFIFSPSIYAQFMRSTGNIGWGYGYGYGYGIGYGWDLGATGGYRTGTDFGGALNTYDYGYGFGYMSAAPSDGVYTLATSDLATLYTTGLIEPVGSDPAATTSVTFKDDVVVEVTGTNGTISTTIPSGAVFTPTDDATFDITALTSADYTSTGDVSGQTTYGTIQFGIPSVSVTSDTAVTISIPLDSTLNLNGTSLSVYRSDTGATSGFSAIGTCTVASNACSFSATSFSYFAAATSSSGGGGGGGGVSNTPITSSDSLIINSGATTTASTTVTLAISAINATEMAISNTSDFVNATWETYATSKTWVLPTSNGVKTVYIKFKNSYGTSSVVSKNITLAIAQLVAESDINNDSVVDDFDFSILMANWGSSPSNTAADINSDGVVDDFDFSILMANWTL